MARLSKAFGSYEAWVEAFVATAGVPGSGWTLLVHDPSDHRLRNVAVEGHTEGAVWGALVLVACDLWEHAYYPDYGPRRAEYVRAFLDLLDWEPLNDRLHRSPYGSAKPAQGVGQHAAMPLPFSPDALSGISAQTVRWQHVQHYAGHVQVRNRIEQRLHELRAQPELSSEEEYAALTRAEPLHIAGQLLHELQWQGLGGSGGAPQGELLATMTRSFGSLSGWRADFLATAQAPAAGWVVLVWDGAARRLVNLLVESNHIGALWGSTPLLAANCHEHAYYYDRGPNRPAYLEAFLNNIDWRAVEARFHQRL